MPEKSFLYMS